MERRIKASIELISRQPEYTTKNITSVIKKVNAQEYEVDIYTPFTSPDDKRPFGEELNTLQHHFKTYNNIIVQFHQYTLQKKE